MGVSGVGKSTVGAALADRLGLPFVDADDLHPAANKNLMSQGIPLTDEDRWPWLALVGAALAQAPAGMVIACSALKRAYRDLIRSTCPDTRFVLLDADRDLVASRLKARAGHFMPPTLLDSQLAILEPLASDEPGCTVPAALARIEVVDRAASTLLDSACQL
ncbi:gluconokinase [Cryobacterium sp. MDB1-18-2]|nr:gluconokinase [Cryobacterium sp. MDB2-A-1]TFC10561.1 gluconokinase [Cryobacterium sp. MDB2-33-2]TFC12977.1 gluconokinase [Cryobacterium sp. MDB2-A-2]TFC17171.1 gluconokinase [Cryobacterium sp. MDB2-10]TFC23245.1 gluconokinase [Cryobacterium sp. MDB1-18-2]TFC40590.1 gluconokinase [Cryobacterium sp. MDB1-18-1]